MIGFMMDTALYTTHWVLSKSLSLAYYAAFGAQPDPLEQRLEHIEQLLEPHSLNANYYHSHKHRYDTGKWIVVSREELVYTSDSKTDALMWIAAREKSDPEHKCLLVQVGDDSSMVEI